jgi:hypothetical protein
MSLGNDSLFTAELNYPTLQRGGIHGWMSFYPFVELKGPFEGLPVRPSVVYTHRFFPDLTTGRAQ